MKKYLLPLVLLGLFLFATPAMANDIPNEGEPTGMGQVGTTGNNFATIHIITGETIKWYEKDNATPHEGDNNVDANGVFNFGSISIDLTGDNAITGDSTTSRNYSGFHTNANQGTFNLGETIAIHATSTPSTAENSNDAIRGFRQLGGTFSGTITGGTNITVIATDSFFAAAATFATGNKNAVSPANPGSFEGATITFGNLTAKTLIGTGTTTVPAEGSGATAFRSGDFTSNDSGKGTQVKLGTLTAVTEYYGEGRYAIGAHIGAINTGSSLTIAGIVVESAASAGGLLSANNDSSEFYALEGSVTIDSGGINVKGFGDSYGIKASTIANLELKGDVSVTSINGGSAGIHNISNFTGSVLGNKNITAKGDNLAVGFGVGGAIQSGANIQLGDLVAAGKDYNGTNNAAAGMAVGFVADGIEAGTINININSITAQGIADAVGISVSSTVPAPAAFSGGTITVTDTIRATSTNGTAFGWFSGAVSNTATLDLQDIDVSSNGDAATGIYVVGDFTGTLKTGTIDVTATAANGATVSGININGAFNPANGGSIGEIDVRGTTTGNVYGIAVTGAGSTFTISNDISATNNGTGHVQGIHLLATTGTTAINVAGSLEITATGGGEQSGGIVAGSSLTLNMQGNHTLTTNSVKVGSDLSVTGTGTANLGTVDSEAFNVKDISRAVIHSDSTTTGGTVESNAILEIADDFRGPTNIKLDTAHEKNLVGGIFTDVVLIDGVIHGKQAKSAKLSDGFLAAFGIHNRYAAWNGVRDQMISGNGRGNAYANQRYGRGYYGQSPCGCNACSPSYDFDPCAPVACNPCDPRATYSQHGYSGGNTAWVNYIGRNDAFDSSYHQSIWKLSMEGVQAGTDLYRTRSEQFGVLFGYESGNMRNVADRIKADDTYVGLYAAKVFRGGADIRGVYAYGWQDYKMNRLHNTVLYKSSFKGNTSEAHLELGKRLSPGPLSFRPVIAVDVMHNNIKGAVETGGASAVRYDKTDLTQVFLRAGSDVRYRMDFFTFNGGVYYSYDLNGAVPSTRVELASDGDTWALLSGPKFGRSLLTFNVGGTCQVSHNFSIIGGYQGEYVFDRTDSKMQSTGYVGGAWVW